MDNFLGRAYPKLPSNKIAQRYVPRTTTQVGCITVPLHYLKIIHLHVCLNMDFYP